VGMKGEQEAFERRKVLRATVTVRWEKSGGTKYGDLKKEKTRGDCTGKALKNFLPLNESGGKREKSKAS